MKLTPLLLLLLLLAGCDESGYGPEKTERAEVYDTCFIPVGHGSGTSVNWSDGSISSHDVTIPAHYAIVFKCQHGKFVIEGDRAENLYKVLSKGDTVDIRYSEHYVVDGGQTNWDKLHFIDATKVND